MADFYLRSTSGAEFVASLVYSLGDKMVPKLSDAGSNVAVAQAWVWHCTTAGTAASSNPTWPSSVTQDVTTVTSGSAVFTARKPGYSSGTTADWAYATPLARYAAVAMSAGDRLLMSPSHNEAGTLAAYGVTFPGTPTNPNTILCVTDSSPTSFTETTGGKIGGSSAQTSMSIAGSFLMRGVTLAVSASASNGQMNVLSTSGADTRQVYENCKLQLNGSGAGGLFNFAINAAGNFGYDLIFKGCEFSFKNAGQSIKVATARILLENCTIASGSTALTSVLFSQNGGGGARGAEVTVRSTDLSNIGSSCSMVAGNAQSGCATFIFRNCLMPSSWSATVLSSALSQPGGKVVFDNCASSTTNYTKQTEDRSGQMTIETTLVKASGSSDGTTAYSNKIISSSDCECFTRPVRSQPMDVWNSSTGSSKTVSVEVLYDSATNLKNNEIWLEVESLNSSSGPLGTVTTSRVADTLTTTADAGTSSSASWTTTGMSNPNKRTLSVSVTPQMAGYIRARVVVGKASQTVYVDPVVTVT